MAPSLFCVTIKITPLLCRGRADLQIKANSCVTIIVGLQTTKIITQEVRGLQNNCMYYACALCKNCTYTIDN